MSKRTRQEEQSSGSDDKELHDKKRFRLRREEMVANWQIPTPSLNHDLLPSEISELRKMCIMESKITPGDVFTRIHDLQKTNQEVTYYGKSLKLILSETAEKIKKEYLKKYVNEEHQCNCDYCGYRQHVLDCTISPFPSFNDFALYYDLEKDVILEPLSQASFSLKNEKKTNLDMDDAGTERAVKDKEIIESYDKEKYIICIYAK